MGEESDVPVVATVATPPPINPEYDPTEDSIIIVPNARVVVREDKKTVLLPDFSQKIIEHRHMDDGTVDVYTRHVHVDGTTTCFEQLGVPESELALGPDGPCFQGEHKTSTACPATSAQLNGVSSGEHGPAAVAAAHHQNEQQENVKRKRINKLVITIAVFVVLIVFAALYAEFLFFPAIIVGIVIIANAVQLATGEATDDCCCRCCDGCCDGCDPPTF